VSNARAAVKEFKERFRPQVLRLLNEPGGKEIALELPEGAIDRLAATLDPIAEAYPVFKPVLDVLGSTLTDIAQARLKAKLDDLTGSVVKHPENVSWQILV
jgi:hypothetical protein